MAPRLWLWLHVATAMVAVSCTYHHERHPHIRRSHTEHHHFLGNFPLNGTKGKDSHISLDSRPSSGPLPYSAPYEDRAQPTPSGHSTRRHQRHQHLRRTHSHRVPDIIYSFGSQSAAKLLYRGKGYHVGPYTGYVDVWTIPRQSRPQYLPPPRLTPSPSPPPSPPHLQRQEEHFPEGTAFARVLIAPEPSNAVSPAEPRTCLRCPKDRTVWVGPGFSCAEVPKPRLRPCSRLASLPGEVRMTATAGPQPGSLVMEGVYQMGFTFQAPGIAPQSCHYKLRVKVRRCPALQRPHNGGVRCSRGRHWGSRCRFFCKPGYALEQRVAARCAIHDGVRVTWTPHPAPVCRAKNDWAPSATTNAIVPDTVMPTRPATEASVPTTPSKKVFPATGSPRPPKRWKQLACRWPKAPLHGWVSCDRGAARKARVVAREGTRCRQGCRWAPLSVVTHFSCVAGAWQGRKALGCTGPPEASTEPAPTELPRTTESGCEGPSPVPNSALECSADANTLGRRPVDTICRHVCDKGYEVLPSQLPLAQVTCLANGKWHQEDQPLCVKSGCASPVILPNSLLDCSKQVNHLGNRPTGTICKVACKEGFTLSPNQQHVNEIMCEEDGTWNQTAEFECHKSGCSSPDLVPDSSLECSNDANHLGHHPTGTLCKIVCNMGLALPPDMQALNQFVCQEDGTWNQTTQLECSSIACPSSKPVPGSSLECSMAANRFGKHPTGTICKVVCADGLSLPSSLQSLNQFVCQEDGTWNQTTQLECRNNGCPGPNPVPDSSLNCSAEVDQFGQWPTGTACQVVCADGLALPSSLQPLNYFVCQEDGTWNQTTQLECRNNGCPSPNPVPDSSLDCSAEVDQFGQWPTGTACQVVCADGLALPSSLQPLNYFVCQEDGTWNQTTQLECRNNGCPSPNPVPDSSLDCSAEVDQFGQWPTGTACQVVCADGLALPSSLQPLNYFVCQEDGTWNQTTQLECRNNGCPSPNPVPDSSLDCSTDVDQFGQWPTGTACQVVCADGLALPSSLQPLNYFVCQEDGTWNQTAQLECRNSGCARPDPVPGASLECSKDGEDLGKWPTGSICNVVCNEGLALPLNLQSLNLFVCLEDGTWNQTAQLECRESGCATPDPVPESSLKCSNDANHLGNRPTGTICEVRCNEGFTLPLIHQSSSQFVCQEDGVWNQTAQLECIKSGCVNLDLTPNSSLECSNEANHLGNRPTGTICKFVCSKGFTLPSNQQSFNQFVCQGDGTWDHETHLECHRVTCDSPPKVSNSVLECSNGTSEDGKWPVGTLCRYTCNEGYAVPKIQDGLNSFTCREDGTWSLTDQLLCEEAGCKSPTQVEDSVLNCTAEANRLGRWPTGATCSYDCKEGYGLAKNQLPFSRIACHDDGTWNQTEELRCKKTGCKDPSTVQFSVVNCSGTANTFGRWPVGTECSHVCDEGYAVSRHEVHLNLFICLDDGTWNQTEGPHCRETGCEEPGKVPHSALNCSSDFNALGKRPFGTVCSYVCNEGFAVPLDLEPHNQFVCSEDGSWNQKEELLCLKTGCESPQVVQNSVLHCSESANSIGNWPTGTTCQHICNNGFVIPQSQLGLGDITCLDDGTWNETDILQCIKLRDPQLSQGCKDEVVVVDGRNVSFPVAVEAPTFKAFNGTNAAVRCTATHVTTYGTHVIVCDAVDTELQSTSSCTYNVTALASGCPPLQSDPYSRVSCSADRNVTEGHLHPVGDVCEYICQLHGYVIPQSKVDSALKECLPNGSWSNDDFHLCQKQLAPVRVSGCEDTEFGTDELGNTTVPRPVFRTGSGQLVNATCTPEMLVDFGDHEINCVAEDHELRSSASCAFKVKLFPAFANRGPVV
ncbi:sushi, von Willebrand factor type A, EGF and pentraxin domain-containing protein 1-like isoform X5 [Dermacentor andersoni]|uniref:sushi, von Willebrand factor type A, EGF and pentraxin domain-containing protein 1-like isoform X5 n=1 Tax=Dermacentor andersoni TaxID=34620 RepID=UPI00215560F8|nr:sushi, von Willebrand factor type A, EGF and pentraxin domain-containing protein 1-like isoform X5 [Dermacentor andersoni]